MRTLSVGTSIKANTALGTEPIIVIKIDWPTGVRYYAEKTIAFNGQACKPALMNAFEIASTPKTVASSEISTVGIELSDTDGNLKTIVNTDQIQGSFCTIYNYYVGTNSSDAVILIKGKISGDINWSEGERKLSFSIDNGIKEQEVGYSLSEGDIPNMSLDMIGESFPLCFGTVLKVPATRLYPQILGTVKTGWCRALTDWGTTPTLNTSPIEIDGGSSFPQAELITMDFQGIRCQGTFDGNKFYPTTFNDNHYTNVLFSDRDFGDPDVANPKVVWLTSSTVSLMGKYCYIYDVGFPNLAQYNQVNLCIKQVGNKCWFEDDWTCITIGAPDGQPTLLSSKLKDSDGDDSDPVRVGKFLAVAKYPRQDWYADFTAMPDATGEYVWIMLKYTRTTGIESWFLGEGCPARRYTGTTDIYIANCVPSTEILEVFGHRTLNSENIFVPIPSSYYTKSLANTSIISGQSFTTISFPKILEDYEYENWSGDVYVSLRSTKPTRADKTHSNVSDIIKWLLQTYTDLSIDDNSFNSVASKVENFPTNFAIFDNPKVVELCQRIAYESRCAIAIRDHTAYLYYLSETPTSAFTATEDNIALKSLQLGFTPIEEVFTKTTNKWYRDYSGRKKEEGRYVKKSSTIATYGLLEDEYEWLIYNIDSLVKLSADFWGYRKSNIWRTAKYSHFLEALTLETFDVSTLSFNTFSTNAIKGRIIGLSHDIGAPKINIDLALASKMGQNTAGQPVEDSGFWLGDPSNPVGGESFPSDVGDGLSEVDYIPEIDSNVNGASTYGDPTYIAYSNSPSVSTSMSISTSQSPSISTSNSVSYSVSISNSSSNSTSNSTSESVSNSDSESKSTTDSTSSSIYYLHSCIKVEYFYTNDCSGSPYFIQYLCVYYGQIPFTGCYWAGGSNASIKQAIIQTFVSSTDCEAYCGGLS